MQDYLRDLDNWTKQMEKKDEQLKQAKKSALSGETSKSREGSPPKRSKKTETKKDEINNEDNNQHPNVIKMESGPVKIKGSDYAAWDKFDIEAACEEVEKEDGEEEVETEDEEVDDERKRVEAVAEKERGNAAFKAGKWDQAIERYTRGGKKY